MRAAWVRRGVLAAGVLIAITGCGGSQLTPAPTPPACGLLTATDIQAAVGLSPSSEGGGGSPARSTCVWALPNSASGSVSVILVRCGTSCGGTFDSLAPTASFTDSQPVLGPGVMVRTKPLAAEVFASRGSVVEIALDHAGTHPAAALQELARRALARLG